MEHPSNVPFPPDPTSPYPQYHPPWLQMRGIPPHMLPVVSSYQPRQHVNSGFHGQFVAFPPMHPSEFMYPPYPHQSVHGVPAQDCPSESKGDPNAGLQPGTQDMLPCGSTSDEPLASADLPSSTRPEQEEHGSPAESISPTVSSPPADQPPASAFKYHPSRMVIPELFPVHQNTHLYSSTGKTMVPVPQQPVQPNLSPAVFISGSMPMPYGNGIVNPYPPPQFYLASQTSPDDFFSPAQNLSPTLCYFTPDTPSSARAPNRGAPVHQRLSQPHEVQKATTAASSVTRESPPDLGPASRRRYHDEDKKHAPKHRNKERRRRPRKLKELMEVLPREAYTVPKHLLGFHGAVPLYTSYRADKPVCALSSRVLLDAKYTPYFYPDEDSREGLIMSYMSMYTVLDYMQTKIIQRMMKDGTVRFPLYNSFGFHANSRKTAYDLRPPDDGGDDQFYYTVATFHGFLDSSLTPKERFLRLTQFFWHMKRIMDRCAAAGKGRSPHFLRDDVYFQNFQFTRFHYFKHLPGNQEFFSHGKMSLFKISFHLLRLMFLELTKDSRLESVRHPDTNEDIEWIWQIMLKRQARTLSYLLNLAPPAAQLAQLNEYQSEHPQKYVNVENQDFPTSDGQPGPPANSLRL